MSQPPLILHAGVHKTGTTAIQMSLAANRAWLRTKGVHYPELVPGLRGPKTAHHAVIHALAKPTLRKRLQLLRFRRRVERVAREMRVTLISAEPVYRHCLGPEPADTAEFLQGHNAYLRRLAHYFRTFEPKVLLYLRRPDALVVSRYKERVTMASQSPDFVEFTKIRPWLVSYPERIAAFRDVFGEPEIRIYETERDRGLLSGFYAGLDLPLPPVELGSGIRISPSNRATLWLRRAQWEAPRSPRAHGFRVIFAISSAGAELFVEQSLSTLWPSDDAFNAFVARYRSAYEIAGFTLPDPPGCPQVQWTDAMHAEAEQAFAEWEHANSAALAERAKLGLPHYQS